MHRIGKVPKYTKKTGRSLNPLMQDLYDKVIATGMTYPQLEAVSGYTPYTFSRWFAQGHTANLEALIAVAESVGYEVKLVKKDGSDE